MRVATEGATATDDLVTINVGFEGQVISFVASSSANDVVFKDGTGNLRLSSDFTATHSNDTITLKKFGSNWLEIGKSDNAV